jgi:hypothetical protein
MSRKKLFALSVMFGLLLPCLARPVRAVSFFCSMVCSPGACNVGCVDDDTGKRITCGQAGLC